MRLCLVILGLLGLPANALSQPACVSYFGEPVRYFFNTSLQDVGMASRDNFGPFIVVNPNVLSQFPPLARTFWFYHECAHHALPPQINNESNADCYAVRHMRDTGQLNNLIELQQMLSSIAQLPGSIWGHLPGPWRAQNMLNCVAF